MQRRSVLITGGTGTLGSVLVGRFAKAGYRVAFQYASDHHKAKILVKKFGAEALNWRFGSTSFDKDLSFDILVNNAGVNLAGQLTHKTPLRSWSDSLYVNVTIPFLLSKAVLPSMLRQRWGRIINISSIYGLRAVEGNCPYTVSKHAISGLTKTIAREYGAHGVTCNEVCPGAFPSRLLNDVAKREVGSNAKAIKAYVSQIASDSPLRRLVATSEIAAAVLFLAGNEASGINGISFTVDGGLIA